MQKESEQRHGLALTMRWLLSEHFQSGDVGKRHVVLTFLKNRCLKRGGQLKP